MKRILLIMIMVPTLCYGGIFEGSINSGIAITSNPKGKILSGPYERYYGGRPSVVYGLSALFNFQNFVQTGVSLEYYALNGYRESLYATSTGGSITGRYIFNKDINIVAELNFKTGDGNYFFIGPSAGLNIVTISKGKGSGVDFAYGGQLGYVYSPIRHFGVFAKASMRHLGVNDGINEYSFFTFPITLGVKVIL